MYCIIQNKGLNLGVLIQREMDRKFSFLNIALTGYTPVKGFTVRAVPFAGFIICGGFNI